MKKALLIFGIIYLSLSACKEDSLLDDNPAPAADNIELNFLPYYGDEPLKTDSIYINTIGSQFIIDTVSMLISDIRFKDLNLEADIDTAKNYVLLSSHRPSAVSGLLPAMGYYGNFQLILGTDSITAVRDQEEVLALAPELVRTDSYGFDFFKIKGRILDFTTIIGDTVYDPIEYTIGTYMLSDTSNSDVRGFSIDNLQQMRIFLLADIKPMLNLVPMNLIDQIISDPSDVQDFTLAEAMADSLTIGIF